MHSERSAKHCPNCEAELHGEYCSRCGQHQVDLDRPFREIVNEGLSGFFAFDTRIVRTVWPLVRRPGFLTTEFFQGRRARYVHPFKLYFTFSLMFFLVFAFSDYTVVHTNESGIVMITTDDGEPAEAVSSGEVETDDTWPDTDAPPSDGLIGVFSKKLARLAEDDPERFDRVFVDRLSKSLIVLVPVVALLLQALYWKPRYVAHLVFCLHVHSFSFLVLVIGAAVDTGLSLVGREGATLGNSIATLAIVVYTFLAMRRVYGQGRLVTGAKILLLLLGYAVALSVTMLGTLIITVAEL